MKPIPISLITNEPSIRVIDAAGAGFPSPAQDWEEPAIDLIKILQLDRAASFVFRVSGDSMIEAGLDDHDILIVDRDKDPCNGSLVIAVCDGGFVVRQIKYQNNVPYLIGRNRNRPYPPRICDENVDIFGVVRVSVRKHG